MTKPDRRKEKLKFTLEFNGTCKDKESSPQVDGYGKKNRKVIEESVEVKSKVRT